MSQWYNLQSAVLHLWLVVQCWLLTGIDFFKKNFKYTKYILGSRLLLPKWRSSCSSSCSLSSSKPCQWRGHQLPLPTFSGHWSCTWSSFWNSTKNWQEEWRGEEWQPAVWCSLTGWQFSSRQNSHPVQRFIAELILLKYWFYLPSSINLSKIRPFKTHENRENTFCMAVTIYTMYLHIKKSIHFQIVLPHSDQHFFSISIFRWRGPGHNQPQHQVELEIKIRKFFWQTWRSF